MPAWHWIGRVGCLALGAVTLTVSAAHVRDGFARDAAVPVPQRMIKLIALPKVAYRDAAESLQAADPRDGWALLARAEALMAAEAPRSTYEPLLYEGLAREPASARGWALLAESMKLSDAKKAGVALTQSQILAPRDYWLSYQRALDFSELWPSLDNDGRRAAKEQAYLLWSEPVLRSRIRYLLLTADGVQLMGAALEEHPEQIRSLNRWLSAERVAHPTL